MKGLNVPEERVKAIVDAMDEVDRTSEIERAKKRELYAFGRAKMRKGPASDKSDATDDEALRKVFKEIFGDSSLPDGSDENFYINEEEYPTAEAVNAHYEELLSLARFAVEDRKQA